MRHLAGILKSLAAVVVLGATTVAVLYLFFDLRVVVDSNGWHLRFVKSADELAAEIEAHRATQRQATPESTSSASPSSTSGALPPSTSSASSPGTPGASSPGTSSALLPPSTRPWPGFRGANRDGRYTEREIVTAWPAAGLIPAWKQPAGGGYASFAVADGVAFTIEQRARQEVVAAYDVETGRELWTHGWNALFSELMGGDGPRATPTWHDGLVYALGATGELRALDAATGSARWRTNILRDHGAANLPWGMSASPLIVDDAVVVLPGGPDGHSVAAYDRRTGRPLWHALDDKAGYAAPMLATLAGERQIVVFSGTRILGLATDGSRLLWSHPWPTYADINAAQPLVVGDNRLFVSSGYGTGAAVLEIVRDGESFAAREVWRNIRMKNQFASSVLHEGFIYGLDEAILACVDAATGDLKWKGGRYGYGQVVLASGHLIVVTEQGDLALVLATPDRHDEITRFPALEGKTWNHPALHEGWLLVRNLQQMAAFDLRRER